MRVTIQKTEGGTRISSDAVIVAGNPVPALTINGTTRKVNKETDDNNVSLIFHSMTVEDAMKLSGDFARFATYLAERSPDAAKSVSEKATSEYTHQTALFLRALDKSGFTSMLGSLAHLWRTRRTRVFGDQETLNSFQKAGAEIYPDDHAPKVRKWLDLCISTIETLSHYWKDNMYIDDEEDVESSINRECQEFRVRACIMGTKEITHGTTERACYSRQHPGPTIGRF